MINLHQAACKYIFFISQNISLIVGVQCVRCEQLNQCGSDVIKYMYS